MNIFEEISWHQFVKLDRISKLQLNEQVKEYNQYIYDLSLARQNWLNDQPKGPLPLPKPGFLQQENLFYILQENGGKIIIT
jgi:hypothetical protein